MGKKKIILLIMICIVISVNLHAGFHRNVPTVERQPDGIVMRLFITGDEFYRRLHDENNFTIIRDKNTRYFCWAKQGEDGRLESTGKPIHLYDPKEIGLEPGEDYSRARIRELIDERIQNCEMLQYMRNRGSILNYDSRTIDPVTPCTGTINQIVIFIRFYDDAEWTTQTSFYEEMFNGFNPGQNSLKRYFHYKSLAMTDNSTPSILT